MNTSWSAKTSNILDDINELVEVIRKPTKMKPSLIYFEGEYYTFSEFVDLMESRKANNE